MLVLIVRTGLGVSRIRVAFWEGYVGVISGEWKIEWKLLVRGLGVGFTYGSANPSCEP